VAQEDTLGPGPGVAQPGEIAGATGQAGFDGGGQQDLARRQRRPCDVVQRGLRHGPAAAAHRHPPQAQPVMVPEGGAADVVVPGPGEEVLGGGQLAQRQRHRGADGVG
jgi:hypothetical protein